VERTASRSTCTGADQAAGTRSGRAAFVAGFCVQFAMSFAALVVTMYVWNRAFSP
jgi:hypothetical protein